MDSAAAPAIETCPNCSTSLLGSNCHEYGQKKIDADEYSLKRFFGRSFDDFTDLESNKVLRTLSALIVRPGVHRRIRDCLHVCVDLPGFYRFTCHHLRRGGVNQ
ncbi:MAG TPA: hypothetical protein VN844_21655 [Pyrinomonadaceae bacterium]|nr:hypothetical protein [Pyrinomonadaceae bacterium]